MTPLLALALAATPQEVGLLPGLTADPAHELALTWGTEDVRIAPPWVVIGADTTWGVTHGPPDDLPMGRFYRHEVVATGLEPSTAYELHLWPGGVDATLSTWPEQGVDPSDTVVVFTAAGDIGTKPMSAQVADLARAFAWPDAWGLGGATVGRPRDFHLALGDLAYANYDSMTIVGGKVGQPDKMNPWPWDLTHRLFCRQQWSAVPVLFALGNHERSEWWQSRKQWHADGPLLRWSMPDPEYYYMVERGPLALIVLDSDLDPFYPIIPGDRAQGIAQLQWLITTLRELRERPSPPRWTIVAQHHPVTGEHGLAPQAARAWAKILDIYDVDLLLTGHLHTTAQWGQLQGGAIIMPADSRELRRADGMLQVVAGGGGRGLQAEPSEAEWVVWDQPRHGFCAVRVTPSALVVVWVGGGGHPYEYARIR